MNKILILVVILLMIALAVFGAFFLKWRQSAYIIPKNMEHSAPLPPRKEVSMSVLPTNTLVLLVIGQSNAGSYGESRYTPHQTNVFVWYRGKMFIASDPLLGTDGGGGSIWTRLGDKLIESGKCEAVVFIAVSAGSTRIETWNPDGPLFPSIGYAIYDAKRSGLNISRVCWIQGESDTEARTPAPIYKTHLIHLIHVIREEIGESVPFYVAQTSIGRQPPLNREIWKVQGEIVDPSHEILAGPNMEKLRSFKFDKVHLTSKGLDLAAHLWEQVLFPESKHFEEYTSMK